MRKGLIIVAVVCVVTALGVASILRVRKTLKVPLVTVQAFSDAIASNDFKGAYALTSSDFKAADSLESFSKMQSHLVSVFGRPQRFESSSFDMETNQYGTHDTVEGRWIFQNGQPVFKFDLKYENGRWLIFSFEQR